MPGGGRRPPGRGVRRTVQVVAVILGKQGAGGLTVLVPVPGRQCPGAELALEEAVVEAGVMGDERRPASLRSTSSATAAKGAHRPPGRRRFPVSCWMKGGMRVPG